MKKQFLKSLSIVLCGVMAMQLMFTGCSAKEEMNLDNGYTTENLGLYEVPEWFRDAKFGIFIHYGVYSVPAYGDEWYGHHMYIPESISYGGDNIYDHHKEVYGGAEKFGYKDFIPEFADNLKEFKSNNVAEQWAELFEQAGAKYVMPVGIHHDSFALYNSDVQTTYNSVNYGNIDYVSELQKACRNRDIKFGISNHFVENDWFFDDNYAEGTDLDEKNEDGSLVYGELYGDGESKSDAHIHKWFDISMEIINKYHPDMIYYDFDLCNDQLNKYDDANRYLMLANYYNQALEYNPDGVVCCYKHDAFTQDEAVLDKERSSLSEIAEIPWQTDTSIGKKAWGYITNEDYRTADQFIGALVDVVSKNGNLLLNVGPEADGTIPDEAKETLLTIGKWLSKYGDAIYATRPWTISGEGPTIATDDSFVYQDGDIRFTRSKGNDKLYITSLAGVNNGLTVNSLKSGSWDTSTIGKISLINGDKREDLEWTQTEKGLEINTPNTDEPFAVEVTFKDNVIPVVEVQNEPVERNANEIIDASIFDESKGAVKAEPTADTEYKGNSLGYVTSGDYVLYKDVDFGNGATKILLRAGADNKNYRVYIDKMKKKNIIAEGNISTGGYNNYETLTVDIEKINGVHDVYIEFIDDAINLNWFVFADSSFKF